MNSFNFSLNSKILYNFERAIKKYCSNFLSRTLENISLEINLKYQTKKSLVATPPPLPCTLGCRSVRWTSFGQNLCSKSLQTSIGSRLEVTSSRHMFKKPDFGERWLAWRTNPTKGSTVWQQRI